MELAVFIVVEGVAVSDVVDLVVDSVACVVVVDSLFSQKFSHNPGAISDLIKLSAVNFTNCG